MRSWEKHLWLFWHLDNNWIEFAGRIDKIPWRTGTVHSIQYFCHKPQPMTYKLQDKSYEPQASSYKLWVTSYELWGMRYKLWATRYKTCLCQLMIIRTVQYLDCIMVVRCNPAPYIDRTQLHWLMMVWYKWCNILSVIVWHRRNFYIEATGTSFADLPIYVRMLLIDLQVKINYICSFCICSPANK